MDFGRKIRCDEIGSAVDLAMNMRVSDTLPVPDTLATNSDRVWGIGTRTWLILGIVAALALAFAAWEIFGGTAKPKAAPAPPVRVTHVGRKNITIAEHTIGTVIANATVQLTARVPGELMSAHFTEGQIVHKGDLLFEIDPRPYQAALDSALATLASTKAKAARYANLLAQKAIAGQDADDAKAAYLQAVAAADTARLNLGFTKIYSPIDGKTGPILIQPGNQITASGVAAASSTNGTSALVVITQIQPVKISFALPQADLPRIQKRAQAQGLALTLGEQGPDGKPLTATVDFIGNEVNDQSGTIELRATFPNLSSTLVPGQLIDVGVVLDSLKGATVVPRDAINPGPNGSFVYIVKNGVAQMVPVTVLNDDGTTAAIKGKVKAGDSIIVDGQLRVVPGKPVTVAKPQKK
jgi:membrane fusion protein, multidrug efflux system